MTKINVCILTYQRGELLRVCLDSFRDLIVPEDVEVVVTIIDNDSGRGAEAIVGDYKGALGPLTVEYICEPTQGIPVARNTAIDFSHEIGADYIAFIDDDEWVANDWLKNTYDYCLQEGGDIVVSGQVISIFPEGCPEHIQQSLQRKPRATGKELTSCATNNVLFPIRLTKELGLRFDVSNPLAGGTDTIFFTQAKAKGVSIVRCAESTVYEKVHESRATIRWISKRKFRAGITEAWRKKHD
ncbi:MAG: glycosyltransferase family 2 protein, partial [Pseudomonadales bacterium]|nr:glycosyltransferase family 2 protein [Pseudomonadales bacterium]